MHLAVLHDSSPPEDAPSSARRRATRGERRIAARLRRRDRDAFAELYATYGGATFGFLVRALGDRGAAEDVQQQVFLEVWQRAADYDPSRASLPTWIMTIARSRAIDHRRRRIPEPRDPDLTVHEIGAEDRAVDELHDRWWLTAVLAELPEEEAAPLRLRFAHGLTQQEIATALDLPLGTVKTRMMRAMTRLRPILAEHGSVRPATAKETT